MTTYAYIGFFFYAILDIITGVLWLPLYRGLDWKHECKVSLTDDFSDCDGLAVWEYTRNNFLQKEFMQGKIYIDFYPCKTLRGVAYHKKGNILRGSSGAAIKGLCQSTTSKICLMVYTAGTSI